MYLLELDLKAGLADSDSERALDSIRMLGNMKHLNSTAELRKLLDSPDLLVKSYVWQALFRLKDYSVLPAVAQFFEMQPEPPEYLFLPRDRLFAMQFELQREIMGIQDPSTLPYLENFAATARDHRLRASALQALRSIDSPHSAAAFLKELDDPNPDNGFSAMQGLLSLAGGGAIEWVPTWKQFDEAPQFYAGECREWWNAEGKHKAAARTADSVKPQ
jgi:HEAT repeat protein